MDCFVNRGFAATTVEQIAEAVGVSRMTVFRYFGPKEDIVFAGSERNLATFRDLVVERSPATVSEVHRCLVHFARDLEEQHDFSRWMTVVDGDRDLLARAGLLRWDLETILAEGHAAALAVPSPDLRLRILASNAIGALFVAARESFHGTTGFTELLRHALREAGLPEAAE